MPIKAENSQILKTHSTLSIVSIHFVFFLNVKFPDFHFPIGVYLRIVHQITSISTHAKKKKSILQAPDSVTLIANLMHHLPPLPKLFLCLETDDIMTFSNSSHDLASSYKKGDNRVFLPWHRNTLELLKLPKLHLHCRYLYISHKFSSLSCLFRCLLLSWKMSFCRIMILEIVLPSRSVQCWEICIF